MRLLWTPRASQDLSEIVSYVASDKPDAAFRLGARLYETAVLLSRMPGAGRSGRVRDTRELMVSSTPYLIIYRVREDEVRILRIRHTAQQRL